MHTALNLEQRLGYRILRWVLATAVICGVIISIVQVTLDAYRVANELELRAQQTISMVRDSAAQAIFSIDEVLAEQVLEGLFALEPVHLVAITHPDGEPLAYQTRPLQKSGFRPVTDPIFGAVKTYREPLLRSENPGVVYGHLQIRFDTAPLARSWLIRAAITFTASVALALILGIIIYVVFHLLLTRPLLRIVRSVQRVNPEQPDDHLIVLPIGHTADDLGFCVNATNNLLSSIGESQQRRVEAENRLSHLARYDQLTGLPSRDTFLEALSGEIPAARTQSRMLALMMCGIDDFKSVNDQCGFRTGDLILQTLAKRLSAHLPAQRFLLARLGSDQFVILERNLKNSFEAAESAEKILACVASPIEAGVHRLSLTSSIGIALYPLDAVKADRLLQHAEQTMALAKLSAHNHFQFYVASIDQQIRERKQLEKDLALALINNEFHLEFQPQVELATQKVIGAEALLRWQHPSGGAIPPDCFIPVAEANGLIVEIGRWVLDQACRQAALWASQGQSLRVAVNLSTVQLRQESIVEEILGALERHGVPASLLELEITETGFMANMTDAIRKLNLLRRAGIQISVDDFGTGYSSLTYLKKMPVQSLKIDKQFVRDLLLDEDDARIANIIIDLGNSLNLTVIAEGVETAEQAAYLARRGCHLVQGYYYSKPMRFEDFESFIQAFHRKIVENNT